MSRVSTRVWVLLALMSAGDIVWSEAIGVGLSHWWPLVAAGVVLLGASLGQRRTRLGARIGGIAEWTLLWIIFSVSGALLTYLAAVGGGPLYDPWLAAADAALGFDWTAWYHFVASHPLVRLPLTIAYDSLVVQILFGVVWFCYLGWEHRNAELLTNAILALVLSTAIFLLFPTLGPCVGLPEFREAYVDDLVGLRNGTLPSLDLMVLKGVVAFPSFHAVLGILFTYAHRGSPTFLPVAVFNALMIASAPSEGGHYLVDVFGGIAVGVVALLATRVIPARAPAVAQAGTA